MAKRKKHPVATEPALDSKDVLDDIRRLVTELKTTADIQTKAERMSKTNEFFLCEPPTFEEDTIDPFVAKQWILRLENIFDCIGCSDEQKVTFAGLRLKDSALSWWTMSKRNLKADGVSVTWEKFKELFDNRYYPGWLQCANVRKLYNFNQGERTVAEYDAEFIKLYSLVSEHISIDAREVARLFDDGLSPKFRTHIGILNGATYPKIRDTALFMERSRNAQDAGRRKERALAGEEVSGMDQLVALTLDGAFDCEYLIYFLFHHSCFVCLFLFKKGSLSPLILV